MLEAVMWTLFGLFCVMLATGLAQWILRARRRGSAVAKVRPVHIAFGIAMTAVVVLHVLGETGVLRLYSRAQMLDLEELMKTNAEYYGAVRPAVEAGKFAEVEAAADALMGDFDLAAGMMPSGGNPDHWKANVTRIKAHLADLKTAARARDGEAAKKALRAVEAAMNACHKEFR